MAWAAGLFEGEGCFFVPKRAGNSLGFCATIGAYTDFDVLQRFQEIIGIGHINGPYENKTKDGRPKKTTWQWNARNFEEGQATAAMFWPWLGKRRKQVVINGLKSYHTRNIKIKGSGQGKLKGKKEEILELRRNGMKQVDIAIKFNVSPSRISVICSEATK